MKYFVTSDVHGFYDEFILALQEKGFDIKNPEHKIIICGDLLDRGSQPKQLIDFVLQNREKIIYVRGNHEDLMEDMIFRGFALNHDVHNGTAATLEDLCYQLNIVDQEYYRIAKRSRLLQALDLSREVNFYETKKYVFVHAWIPVFDSRFYDKDWRTADEERWRRARWENPTTMYNLKLFEPNKTIVCGHWHCSALWNAYNPAKYPQWGKDANFEPFIQDGIIALDACAAYTKKVNVVVLQDE